VDTNFSNFDPEDGGSVYSICSIEDKHRTNSQDSLYCVFWKGMEGGEGLEVTKLMNKCRKHSHPRFRLSFSRAIRSAIMITTGHSNNKVGEAVCNSDINNVQVKARAYRYGQLDD
jgi:hypothetical protein